MSYDYKKGKDNILEILGNKTEIQKRSIPKDEGEFTYENGIKSWIAAIFVDIVDSTSLFKDQREDIVSRIMRSFASEIIDILKSDAKPIEIGLRGDSVYAVYSASYKSDLVDVFRLAYQINTFMKMFNTLLKNNQFPSITAGIGLGASEDLIIKAGKKQTEYNDFIFVGNAVVDASNFSGEANRQSIGAIVMSPIFYNNIIELLQKENPSYSDWIQPKYSNIHNYTRSLEFYHCSIIQSNFDEWIREGMK